MDFKQENFSHYSVMQKEVLEFFSPLGFLTEPPGIAVQERVFPVLGRLSFLDCTLGEAGHTLALMQKFPQVNVCAIERDQQMLSRALFRLKMYNQEIESYLAWFDEALSRLLKNKRSFDAILMDVGISLFHYTSAQRGFSFQKEEVLDMRLDQNQDLCARQVINSYSEKELARVFYEHGQERRSRFFAKAIVKRRREKRIETAKELGDLILAIVRRSSSHFSCSTYKNPKKSRAIHPATKIFQALRIEVNDELSRLKRALPLAFALLKPGGRLAVLSFHSLEDKEVKHYFRSLLPTEAYLLNKKPLVPSSKELQENPPSRSAKLRVIEKLV